MADAGGQRQRHRVGDVGADDARRRQLRIKQDQGGDADGAGADRRDRHQHAEHGADDDGQRRDPLRRQRADPRRVAVDEPVAKHQHQRGGKQRQRQHAGDELARRRAVDVDVAQRPDGQDRQRHAAGGEPPHHAPIDGPVIAMHQAAGGLGRRGVEQVGADRGRRMDAEQHDQDRRHQRAAADAGQADQHADGKAGHRVKRLQRLDRVHAVISQQFVTTAIIAMPGAPTTSAFSGL